MQNIIKEEEAAEEEEEEEEEEENGGGGRSRGLLLRVACQINKCNPLWIDGTALC